MEQPKFGQPPESSYYVSSSEFTSKDVEEFKKISRNVPRPVSECSSSSHVSAPDPPHMNTSPAAYVQKFDAQIGSYSSDITHESEEDKFSIEKQVENRFSEKIEGDGPLNKASSDNTDSLCNNIEIENNFGIGTVGLSLQIDTVDNKTSPKQELEESWEEFYKSPLRKTQDDSTEFRKVQRLESINRDAKEEAILSSITDEETFDQTDRFKANPEQLYDDSENRVGVADNLMVSEIQKLHLTAIGTEASNVCDDKKQDLIFYDIHETQTTETSELLDESQKLLNELGIEDNVESLTSDTNKEEDLVSDKRKANKVKKKSAADRLKPQLSLSPPKSDIVEPELSNAVADKVDQIRTLENPEYLSKHRLSLQYTGNVRKPDKYGHRKSLPGVLEHKNENDGDISYRIEDHLYDGLPLDDTIHGMSRSPVIEDDQDNADEVEKLEAHDPNDENVKRLVQRNCRFALFFLGQGQMFNLKTVSVMGNGCTF